MERQRSVTAGEVSAIAVARRAENTSVPFQSRMEAGMSTETRADKVTHTPGRATKPTSVDTVSVRDAVVAIFLRTGEASSAPEIAAELGVSTSRVRRVIEKSFGAVNGTTYDKRERPSYSTNYPMWQHGVTREGVWMPTFEHLRQLLLNKAARSA